MPDHPTSDPSVRSEARAVALARVDEALAASGPGVYAEALGVVLNAVPLPVAAVWAARRSAAVERIVRAFADRLLADPHADLLPRERIGIRHAAGPVFVNATPPEPGIAGRLGAPLLRAT